MVYLRPATLEDVPAIAEVIAQAFEGYRGKLTPPSSSLDKTPEAVRRELTFARAFVVEKKAALTGCIFFQVEDGALYVSRLAVLPAHQGQGVGKRLLDAVTEEAKKQDFTKVRLSVRLVLKDLTAYYQNLGFKFEAYGTHAGFTEPTFVTLCKEW